MEQSDNTDEARRSPAHDASRGAEDPTGEPLNGEAASDESWSRPAPLRLGDFINVNLEEDLGTVRTADCNLLGDIFQAKLKELTAPEHDAERRVYFALAQLCRLHFKPGDRAEPFAAMVVWADGSRSAIPDDFAGDQTLALTDAFPRISNVALRTRIADVCWLNHRVPTAAEAAISGYLSLADGLVNSDYLPRFDLPQSQLHEALEYLTRAVHMAAATKKRKSAFPEEVVNSIRALVDAAERDLAAGSTVYRRAVKLAFRYGFLKADELLLRVQRALEVRAPSADPDEVRSFHFILAAGFDDVGRFDDAIAARTSAAEEHVRRAEMVASSGMLASHWYMQAIAELRRIKGTGARTRELERRLREVQPLALEEMVPISHSVDISDIVERAIDAVDVSSVADCLGALASFASPRSVKELRADALQRLKGFPLSAMFGGSHLDDEGRVRSHVPGASLSGEPEEAWIKNEIAQNESQFRNIAVQGQIEPARRWIVDRHSVRECHIDAVVAESWFVPPGNRGIFSNGLLKFLRGDFVCAVHVLVPQFEAAMRYTLKLLGVDATRLESDLVQKDPSLSIIIEKYSAALLDVFGEDLLNEIDHLFLYEGGPSLRHSTAHGKLSEAACYSADAVYACWFIFRLVFRSAAYDWEKLKGAIDSASA